MKAAGGKWAVLPEERQECCLARVGGRARFIENLATPQVEVPIHDAFVKYPAGAAASLRAGPDVASGMSGASWTTCKSTSCLCGPKLVERIAEACNHAPALSLPGNL
jgi:hypothetical protein